MRVPQEHRVSSSMELNVSFLQSELEKSGYKKVFYFPEMTSTMPFIRALALQDPSQIVVIADHQTSGVGREGRIWYDKPEASILMSILFQIPETAIGDFADLVALQTCIALRECTKSDAPGLKWPNDIVANGKKLGGILVENIYDNNRIYRGTNVGIGINVHYSDEELAAYPTDYGAISLDTITGTINNRQTLILSILQRISTAVPDVIALQTNPSFRKEYDTMWQEFAWVLGKEIEVIKDDTIITSGTVIDARIGKGIVLRTEKGIEWVNQFETQAHVRIKN